jgi:general secretion pathway protein K
LLLALIILTLVTTVTAGMVWQQSRAVDIESAERARAQAGWILNGALDWARLILREDQRSARQRGNPYTSLDDAWSKPLEEARLSSFLAADQNNNADSEVEAFISGRIADAQARFNLRGVVDAAGKPLPVQVDALQRVANLAGAPSDTATRIAGALSATVAPQAGGDPRGPVLRPETLDDLVWLGIEPATLRRLADWVTLLPVPTPVNVNTAPREVLMAAIDGLDLGSAERLVQARGRQPFASLEAMMTFLPEKSKPDPIRVAVSSNWFEVAGRLRLEERVLEERSLLQRDGEKVTVRRRDRHSFTTAPR